MFFFKLSKKALLLIIIFLLTINLALFSFLLEIKSINFQGIKTNIISEAQFPEIMELAGNAMNFNQLYDYFTLLSNNKGGEYAFEILKLADIPQNTDLHLLGHAIGDILYKQRGVEGIKICTHDFRNACSHAIVVGTLLEKGPESLGEIADTCHLAPGGKGAYTMCFHGLGHGVLAYTNYELPDAVSLCQKTGTAQYNNQESVQCIGGIIMEIISGGDHNKTLWEQKNKKYLTSSDPLYPCTASFMPNDAKVMCYTYLTPHLFNVAEINLSDMAAEDIRKAFTFCKNIPSGQQANRDACFAGFGKEFVVLAQSRDIRNIDKMTTEQFQIVNKWCALSSDNNAKAQCMKSALSSIYWGGENNRSAAIRFCSSQSNTVDTDVCFSELIVAVQYYIDTPDYKTQFCQEIPLNVQDKCRQLLSI